MAAKIDQAISAANALMNLMGTFKAFRQQVNDYVTNYNSEGWSSFWNSFATAAQNADGSLGAADGTANTSHPIDTRVSSQAALTKAVSATQLVNAVACLQQLQNFLTNAAVTQGNHNQNIDDLAS